MEHAAFLRDRLRTLRPRLEHRSQQVRAEEYLTHWRADYDALKIKRDELAVELSGLYPPAAQRSPIYFGVCGILMRSFLAYTRRVLPASLYIYSRLNW